MATVPINNMTDTWNAGGTVFSAIKMNVTDTASALSSMLMDLQIGSVPMFRVSHKIDAGIGANFCGVILGNNGLGSLNNFAIGADDRFLYLNAPGVKGSGEISFTINWESGGSSASFSVGDFGAPAPTIEGYCNTNAGGVLGWSNSINASPNGDPTVLDTFFRRRAAGIVDLKGYNLTTPFALAVYNNAVVDNNQVPTNYERGVLDWNVAANVFSIGTQKGGTGTGRAVRIVGGPTSGAPLKNFGVAPSTKTTTYTVVDADQWLIFNGGGSITVTLPTASTQTGREITMKTIAAQTVVSASSNVAPAASATAGTAILGATAGKFATLVSDGTNWVIMQSN